VTEAFARGVGRAVHRDERGARWADAVEVFVPVVRARCSERATGTREQAWKSVRALDEQARDLEWAIERGKASEEELFACRSLQRSARARLRAHDALELLDRVEAFSDLQAAFEAAVDAAAWAAADFDVGREAELQRLDLVLAEALEAAMKEQRVSADAVERVGETHPLTELGGVVCALEAVVGGEVGLGEWRPPYSPPTPMVRVTHRGDRAADLAGLICGLAEELGIEELIVAVDVDRRVFAYRGRAGRVAPVSWRPSELVVEARITEPRTPEVRILRPVSRRGETTDGRSFDLQIPKPPRAEVDAPMLSGGRGKAGLACIVGTASVPAIRAASGVETAAEIASLAGPHRTVVVTRTVSDKRLFLVHRSREEATLELLETIDAELGSSLRAWHFERSGPRSYVDRRKEQSLAQISAVAAAWSGVWLLTTSRQLRTPGLLLWVTRPVAGLGWTHDLGGSEWLLGFQHLDRSCSVEEVSSWSELSDEDPWKLHSRVTARIVEPGEERFRAHRTLFWRGPLEISL